MGKAQYLYYFLDLIGFSGTREVGRIPPLR
jgi:hypothetical protein